MAAQRELLGAPPTASDQLAGSGATGSPGDVMSGPLMQAWAAGRALAVDDAIAEALTVDVLLETA